MQLPLRRRLENAENCGNENPRAHIHEYGKAENLLTVTQGVSGGGEGKSWNSDQGRGAFQLCKQD
jgi:hypothetical protein